MSVLASQTREIKVGHPRTTGRRARSVHTADPEAAIGGNGAR